VTPKLFSVFIKLVSLVAALLGLAFLLEQSRVFTLPEGTYLCFVEFVFGLSSVIWSLRSGIKEVRYFGWAVLSIVVADTIFYFLNYYQNVSLLANITTVVSSFLYGIGYLLCSSTLIQVSGIKPLRDWKKILVPALIVLVTFTYYFLPSMLDAKGPQGTLLEEGVHGFVIITNSLVAIVGMTILIHSMNPFLVFMSLGFTIMALVNYAMSSEIFDKGNAHFGFYEYFWASGTFTAETSLLLFSSLLDPLKQQRSVSVSGSSIGVQYKASIISVVMLVLTGASVFVNHSGLTIRMVTLGIVIGVVFALIFSSFTVETVSRYASVLGRVLQQGFTSQVFDQKFVDNLPMELEVLFSSVFAQSLERERDRQVRLLRYNELYQKFAHDVRAPLKAISNLLAEAEFKDEGLRAACIESIGSMNRVSQSILEDVEIGRGQVTAKISMPATPVSDLLSRVLKTFEMSHINRSEKLKVSVENTSQYSHAWIDADCLERFLMNVLNNSSESKGVTSIEIRVLSGEREIQIEVRDDGMGVAPEVLKRLNEGVPLTTKVDGHGLGLAAHRAILMEQEGAIHYESEQGRYFKTSLKMRAASSRIVLIDDDRAIQLAWVTLARLKGVEIKVFGPNDDFLRKLQSSQDRHTEIYVDYRLGALSGIDVLSQLKSLGFENLFLATADEVGDSIRLNWKVRDKSFPR
jgi:hypothetical protein